MNTKLITVRLCSLERYNQYLTSLGFPSQPSANSNRRHDEYATIHSSPSFPSFRHLVHTLSQEELDLLRFVQVHAPREEKYTQWTDHILDPDAKKAILKESAEIASTQGKLMLEFNNERGGHGRNSSKWTANTYHFRRRNDGSVLCARLYIGTASDAFEKVTLLDFQGGALHYFAEQTRHLYAAGDLERMVGRS